MERHGFIHDMMDVKVLILYVMNRVLYPIDEEKIYALCYQDDCLSYFDVRQAIPQLVESGHLCQTGQGYAITDAGRETCAITEDSLAFPVARRAAQAAEEFNRQVQREDYVQTQVITREDGALAASLVLKDDALGGPLMRLELTAPNMQQARRLAAALQANGEPLFQTIMRCLQEEQEGYTDPQ